MNRAERIYRLHELLSGPRPVPLARLQEQAQASRATVVRDIRYMRDFFEASILYDRERNGYWFDPDAPKFELPGLFFNESELFGLLAAERLLEDVQPGILRPKLGPLKARIRKLLAESGHNAETVSQRVQIRGFAPRRSDTQLFDDIAEAVLAGQALEILYHARGTDEVTRRQVHCARLIHYRANWYLLARCERAKGLRLFALERIRESKSTGRPAQITVDDRELDRFVNASFGIFSGEAKGWADIRFTPEAARWVADEAWHPDQIGHWQDGHYRLQVPYSDTRELLMEVLRHGPDAEILAPGELRNEAKRRLQNALAAYQRDSADH